MLNLLAGLVAIACLLPAYAHAATVREWGGSAYVAVAADATALRRPGAWQDTAVFQTPACTFSGRISNVRQDLRAMYNAHQRKLDLVLWFMAMNKPDCSGYLLSSADGRLSPLVIRNLQAVLKLARDIGFEEIQVRFAAQGENDPAHWRDWNEAMYEENWSLIQTTIQQLRGAPAPRLVFDLGVELGGIAGHATCAGCGGIVTRYDKEVWAAYVKQFDAGASYGFSIAAAPDRVTRLLADLASVGPVPSEIALDLYAHPDVLVAKAARELKAAGYGSREILVQETYYDDSVTYSLLTSAARAAGVTLRAIMQWPVTPGQKTQISVGSTPIFVYAPQ